MVLKIQDCLLKHTEAYWCRSNTEGLNFCGSNFVSHMGNADIMFHFMEMLMELIKWELSKLQNILSLVVHTLSNMIRCCLTLGLTGSAPFSHRWMDPSQSFLTTVRIKSPNPLKEREHLLLSTEN